MGRKAKSENAYKPVGIEHPTLGAVVKISRFRRGAADLSWSVIMTLPSGAVVGPISAGKPGTSQTAATIEAMRLYEQFRTKEELGAPIVTGKVAKHAKPSFADACVLARDYLTDRAIAEKKVSEKKAAKFEIKGRLVKRLQNDLGHHLWPDIRHSVKEWGRTVRNKDGSIPLAGTIGNLNDALQEVNRAASAKGWLPDDPAMWAKLSKKHHKEGTKEPSFTKDEMIKLRDFMDNEWLYIEENYSTIHRHLVRFMVALIATAGIRPGLEVEGIYESHIEVTDDFILINIAAHQGKHKDARSAVVRENDVFNIRAMYAEFMNWRQMEWHTDKSNIDDAPIFANPHSGKVPRNLGLSFSKLLTAAGLSFDPKTRKNRVLYSLRHYCISSAMRDRATDYDLILLYGTSQAMIMKHYSDVRGRDIASRIADAKAGAVEAAKRTMRFRLPKAS
jgi:hypothetical protein